MSVTASRLGSAPLAFDWTNLTRGSSVDPEEAGAAWAKLKSRFNQGEVGFYDCPIINSLSQIEESQALADSILKQGKFTDCLILGIGGSALGPVSLLSALSESPTRSGIAFHFVENPDPIEWKATIKRLNRDTTLVCAITKSGTTFETMAQLLLALEWLGKDRYRKQVVAITDPAKGDLKAFATQEGLPTLHIAPSMGGRFSIFTPVGLFPAALAGLNIQNFMLGARQVRDYVEKAPLEKNPIFVLGSELLRHSSKRSVHVCMPYSTKLKLFSAWFVQLWGESLGKDGKGFTPIAAVGATDQHSILQLLRDGPDDKVTLFVTLDQVEDEVKIPFGPVGPQATQLPAFKILEGHTLQELLSIEYRATSLVLTRQGRPNASLKLDKLDERSLGALYFSVATLTAFTGALMGINPFDQPGVEEGKVYIREALTQQGASRVSGDGRDEDENSPVNRLRRDRNQD